MVRDLPIPFTDTLMSHGVLKSTLAFKLASTTFFTRVRFFFVVLLPHVFLTTLFIHEVFGTSVYWAEQRILGISLSSDLFHSGSTRRTLNFRVRGGREREADVSDNDENRGRNTY